MQLRLAQIAASASGWGQTLDKTLKLRVARLAASAFSVWIAIAPNRTAGQARSQRHGQSAPLID